QPRYLLSLGLGLPSHVPRRNHQVNVGKPDGPARQHQSQQNYTGTAECRDEGWRMKDEDGAWSVEGGAGSACVKSVDPHHRGESADRGEKRQRVAKRVLRNQCPEKQSRPQPAEERLQKTPPRLIPACRKPGPKCRQGHEGPWQIDNPNLERMRQGFQPRIRTRMVLR